MKKEILGMIALLLLFCMTACSKSPLPDPVSSSETTHPTESESVSDTGSSDAGIIGQDTLEYAVNDAILTENRGKYWAGECQGIGCRIFETFTEDNTLSVYAMIEYIEYAFQDDAFVNISGTRHKALLRFRTDDPEKYQLLDYTVLDPTSGLTDAELEQLMQPLQETGKEYLYSDQELQELRTQADACAEAYLQSIGRNAVVRERDPHEENSIWALGIEESVAVMLTKDARTSIYPDWVGTMERIEDSVRYVYRTEYDPTEQVIRYTKTQYDTEAIVETMAFDAVSGEEIE